MIKHNYHAHTNYCHHSELTPEEAVKLGIKLGLETMGFSEHIWLPGDKGQWRLESEAKMYEYIKEVQSLKEKYKNQIRILIGLESEIFDYYSCKTLVDHINHNVNNPEIDYVILGHHNYFTKKHVFAEPPNQEELDTYVEHFKLAVEKTNILYIAHPDGFLKGAGEWTKEYRAAARAMIKAAVDNNIPFGLNVNGMLYGLDFCYPNLEYFKMVAEAGGVCVLELDAHTAEAYDPKVIQKVYDLAKEAGVKIIDKLL